MTRTYEQVFLAIAVRNGMMKKETAQACLAEYSAGANGAGSIEEVVRAHGALTDGQISLLQSGVKKVFPRKRARKTGPPLLPREGRTRFPATGSRERLGSGGRPPSFSGNRPGEATFRWR